MKYLLLFIPLLMMAFEDFRHRAIHWAWLLVLSGGILWCYRFKAGQFIANIILVAFQLMALTLYFTIKQKKLVYLPSDHLGWGDIFFYVPLCLFFSPENLVFFTVLSLLLTLVAFRSYQLFHRNATVTVPLAGCMSICLIAAMTVGFILDFDFKHDSMVWQIASTSKLYQY